MEFTLRRKSGGIKSKKGASDNERQEQAHGLRRQAWNARMLEQKHGIFIMR